MPPHLPGQLLSPADLARISREYGHLKHTFKRMCPTCSGTGAIDVNDYTQRCSHCGGTRWVQLEAA